MARWAAEACNGACLCSERDELLVSLHYSFKMLQTYAGEAAGRLTVPEVHTHHLKLLSEMYSCLPADVKCTLVPRVSS